MSGSSDYTTTPNLGLFKPNYDMDDGQWGYHLNTNADKLDAALGSSGPFLPLSGGQVNGSLTIWSEAPNTLMGYWGIEADVTNHGPAGGTAHKFGYLSYADASTGGAYDIGFTNFTTHVNAGTRAMGMWFFTVSPNDQVNPFSCQLGEWNIVNRGPDCGWMADPSGRGHVGGGLLNATGGLTIIPMADAGGAAGGGEGKNVTYGFCTASGGTNSVTGLPVKIYTSYIVSANTAVGGTGRGAYFTGDTTGVTAQIPYGPLGLDGNWLHGIDHTQATYTDNHAETMNVGQGIAWIIGPTTAPTATASIVGVGIGGPGDASLILTAAGSGVIRFGSNVANTTFVNGIYMGGLTGSTNWDTSKGIDFYGGILGFGITAARLNYIVPGGNAHMFVINNVDVASVNAGGITAASAMQVGGTSGPTWTTGSAAPAATAPVGSLYSRVGGAVGATLYVSRGGGTWNAVAGV